MNKPVMIVLTAITALLVVSLPHVASAQEHFLAMKASFDAEAVDASWAESEAQRYVGALQDSGYTATVECRSNACFVSVEVEIPAGSPSAPAVYLALLDEMFARVYPAGLFLEANSGMPIEVDKDTVRWEIIVVRKDHRLPVGVTDPVPSEWPQ